MGQWVLFNFLMVSPKVPTTLVTQYSYPMGHHSHSFVNKNGLKLLKTGFWGYYLHNLLFYTQICLWANRWYSVILWYHPKCLLHLWPQISTLWATIATHLRAEMAENGWKQIFDDTHFQNLLFYTQICSMGQQIVFNCPMVLPKVPSTLTTPYSYHMGHHSHWFVSKNGQKRLKTGFWRYLLPKPPILHKNMFNYPMVSPKVHTLLMTLYSYPISHPRYSFLSKNGWIRLKNVFWRC